MITLASTSSTRQRLLQNAGVDFVSAPPMVDEEAIRAALIAAGEKPRDIADALAEAKAKKLALKRAGFVLGVDQICALDGEIFAKPDTKHALSAQLQALSGKTHQLFSAAVLYKDGAAIWRFIGEARLTMRPLSDAFIEAYVKSEFESVRHSAGGYHIEGKGAQLMSRVQGDYFTILGLPLLEVLGILRQHEELAS